MSWVFDFKSNAAVHRGGIIKNGLQQIIDLALLGEHNNWLIFKINKSNQQ